MKRTFFAKYSILILMALFFLFPFALRGARLSLDHLKNDVKDWLPDSFAETKELDWFRRHFAGEQFVVASWEGCTAKSNAYKLLIEKLKNEIPPNLAEMQAEAAERASAPEEIEQLQAVAREDYRAIKWGDVFGICLSDKDHRNWAGLDEIWMRGDRVRISEDPTLALSVDEAGKLVLMNQAGRVVREMDAHDIERLGNCWYYLTPEGELYRYTGSDSLMGAAWRFVERNLKGENTVQGELVATFGGTLPEIGKVKGENRYHADPGRVCARLFKTVTSGPLAMEQMIRVDGPLWSNKVEPEIARQEAAKTALARLEGTLFGPVAAGDDPSDWENRQTCVVATVSEAGKRHLAKVVGRGQMGEQRGRLLVLAEECGISGDQLKRGGPPVDNIAIDEEGKSTLLRLLWLSLAVGMVLSYLCFRSINVTIMVFLCGGMSAVTSLAIVWWAGSHPDAVLMSMPSLVYVLGLSCAVHIVNYYRDAVTHGDLDSAATLALKHSWKPSLFCQLTTAFGLLSLLTSDLIPIRKFGLYSAIGVIATLLIVFIYLPAALQVWPPGYHRRETKANAEPSWFYQVLARFFRGACEGIVRHNLVVILVIGVLTVGFGLGLRQINTSVKLLEMFDGSSKIIHDYTWLEQNLGRLVPMELVVRVDPTMLRPALEQRAEGEKPNPAEKFQYTFLERMEMAERVHRIVEKEFGETGRNVVGKAMSAATFSPELPAAGGSGQAFSVRSAYARQLEQHRQELLASDYVKIDRNDSSELWRISLRLGAMNKIDYGDFVHELETAIEPVMKAYRQRTDVLKKIDERRHGEGFAGGSVVVLGAPIARYLAERTAQEKAANDRAKSGDAPALLPTETRAHTTDVQQLFSLTLYDLLKNARLRVEAPSEKTPFARDKEWERRLANADAVVLAGAFSDADLEFVRHAAGAKLIDATAFGFNRAEGEVTARMGKEQVSTVYTGLVPVVYKAQRTLLDSLVQSCIWSFFTIAPLMIIQLRTIAGGIISMVPNVFPIVIVFGALGYLQIPIDIGTMMTASIALGIAVDDTIHFLSWYSDSLSKGMSRHEAILSSYEGVAPAMVQTAVIAGVGLSVFCLSTFTPTQRFGVMMLTVMLTAMWGDLILTPAILASPIGWIFGLTLAEKAERDRRRGKKPKESVPAKTAPKPHSVVEETVASPDEDRQAAATSSTPNTRHSSRAGKEASAQVRQDPPHGVGT